MSFVQLRGLVFTTLVVDALRVTGVASRVRTRLKNPKISCFSILTSFCIYVISIRKKKSNALFCFDYIDKLLPAGAETEDMLFFS